MDIRLSVSKYAQVEQSKKKIQIIIMSLDTQPYIQKVQTCAPVLSLSQKRHSPEDIKCTHTKKERYVAFYCKHTQTFSFSDIITD